MFASNNLSEAKIKLGGFPQIVFLILGNCYKHVKSVIKRVKIEAKDNQKYLNSTYNMKVKEFYDGCSLGCCRAISAMRLEAELMGVLFSEFSLDTIEPDNGLL